MRPCSAPPSNMPPARLPVFPCVPNGKLPAIARGFYAATTNPETIKRYWRRSDRNIGIPTGSVSGFWVLDVDGDAGKSSIRALEAEHGRLPPTREVITGGGGRHLWFEYTGPIQSTADRIARGIDTRGDGGYVIVPPINPSERPSLCVVGDSTIELAHRARLAHPTRAQEAGADRFRSARSQPSGRTEWPSPMRTDLPRSRRDRGARCRAARHA